MGKRVMFSSSLMHLVSVNFGMMSMVISALKLILHFLMALDMLSLSLWPLALRMTTSRQLARPRLHPLHALGVLTTLNMFTVPLFGSIRVPTVTGMHFISLGWLLVSGLSVIPMPP
jgi:hypothetical protein